MTRQQLDRRIDLVTATVLVPVVAMLLCDAATRDGTLLMLVCGAVWISLRHVVAVARTSERIRLSETRSRNAH